MRFLKEFEKAKNEYFAITASEELKRKVEKTMKQNKKKRASAYRRSS